MLLVTGITGYSGTHFLKELIENKYEGRIRCLVRETSDTSLIEKVQWMGEGRHFPQETTAQDFNYRPMPFSEGLQREIEEYLDGNNGSGVFAK